MLGCLIRRASSARLGLPKKVHPTLFAIICGARRVRGAPSMAEEIIGYANGEPIYADVEAMFQDFQRRSWDDELREHYEDKRDYRDRNGKVYFIQAEHGGPVKIGWSDSPSYRLRELQTGNPYKLVIRKTLPGGPTREAEVHEDFAHARIGASEWFKPVPELCLLCGCRADEVESVPREKTKPAKREPRPKSEAQILEDRHAETMKAQRQYWADRNARGISSPT